MTKNIHTPGPWEIHGDYQTLIGVDDGKAMIADVIGPSAYHLPEWRRPLAEAQANAHLIATAPELLAELADWHRLLSDPRFVWTESARSRFVKHAGAVIAKAQPVRS